MRLEGKTVVVIGGAGFIGSHLAEALLREKVERLAVIDNFSSGRIENLKSVVGDTRVEVCEGDILHADVLDNALEGADCVFHLAALWLLHCRTRPREAFRVNVEGTFNVLETCVRNGVEKLVYSSSASVYGDPAESPIHEEHALGSRTFYGATKIAGEQMCRAFFAEHGLDYLALRYMNVYGPRQSARSADTGVVPKMMDRLERGLPPLVHGDGSQSLDFIHVEDVAKANICGARSEASDASLNVGTGEATTIRELAERLMDIWGVELPIEFSPDESPGVRQRIGSVKSAQEALGFRARVGLREGLKRTVAWWRTDCGRSACDGSLECAGDHCEAPDLSTDRMPLRNGQKGV